MNNSRIIGNAIKKSYVISNIFLRLPPESNECGYVNNKDILTTDCWEQINAGYVCIRSKIIKITFKLSEVKY